MKRLLILFTAFAMLGHIVAAQDQVAGSLGQSHSVQMQAGELYEFQVLSYYFTPGIYFYPPNGERFYSIEDSVFPPYHDGSALVRGTQTRFAPQQSGNWQIQVFSWDRQEYDLPYTMVRYFVGAAADPNPPPVVPPKPPGGGGGNVTPPRINCGGNDGIQRAPDFSDLPCAN